MIESRRILGRTGLEVSPMGIGGGYGIRGDDVVRAFDRGINFFFWATWVPTYRHMLKGLKELLPGHRDQMVVTSGTYFWLHSKRIDHIVYKHLKKLGIEQLDVFFLSWVMLESQQKAFDRLLALKEKGLIRHLAISGHNRKMLARMANQYPIDVLMVRYNAAHPGAETDIFSNLSHEDRPGIVAFNALKHGKMLKRPRKWPTDRPLPSARQCYRFAISHPCVDVCLAGVRNQTEVNELVQAIQEGNLLPEELDFMRDFGRVRHG